MPEVVSEETKQMLRNLLNLRDARDQLKADLTAAEAEYREADAEVWLAFEESGLKNDLKVDLGEPYGSVRFGPRETHYARVLDSERLLEYFEQRAMVDEHTAPKIVGKRINELVNTTIEAGGNMPPGLDYTTRRFVSITRPKAA